MHPDISAAYDSAQDTAAQQIIGWLAQHATTRVGLRGGQIQIPVTEIDTMMVRHHTSRAGDSHWRSRPPDRGPADELRHTAASLAIAASAGADIKVVQKMLGHDDPRPVRPPVRRPPR